MTRIAITDGSGRWFSQNTAEYFKEDTYHNGNNWISKATGTQFEHEGLYRTAGGRFILHKWTDYQGGPNTYEEVSNEDAAIWFSINGYEPHDQCKKEFEDLEIK